MFLIAGPLIPLVMKALTWIGAGNAALGAFTVASVSYSAFSGFQAYKAGKAAEREAKLAANNRSAFLNYREPIPFKRLAFGRVRTGGPLLFAHTPTQGEAHLFVALCAHSIDSIESVWVGREEVVLDASGNAGGKWAGAVKVHKILGDGVGLTLADHMINEGLGAVDGGPIIITDEWSNIAGLYVVLTDWAKKFAGDQPDFSAIFNGYDYVVTGDALGPGGYTIEHSDNPVWIARTYMLNYMGITLDRFAPLQADADYCDDLIALKAGGTEKRYTCNGLVIANERHEAVLEDLANSFAGSIRYAGGLWHISAKPTENLGFILTEDDMLDTFQFNYGRSARELPNAIRGSYMDPDRNWQATPFPPLDRSGGGVRDFLEIELLFTQTHTAAQRIAKIFLTRAQAQESTNLTVSHRALSVIPGDVITFTSSRLGRSQSMEVVDSALSFRTEGQSPNATVALDVQLGLQAYDPTAWDWVAATDEKDLSAGEVDLGGIIGKGPTSVESVVTVNTTVKYLSTNHVWDWVEPIESPEGTSFIGSTLEVIIEVVDTNGVSTLTTYTKQLEGSITYIGRGIRVGGALVGEARTYTHDIISKMDGGPGTYASHTILSSHLRSRYGDGSLSEWVDSV